MRFHSTTRDNNIGKTELLVGSQNQSVTVWNLCLLAYLQQSDFSDWKALQDSQYVL